MYTQACTVSLALLAGASLAWFVVGVLAGQRLPRLKVRTQSRQRKPTTRTSGAGSIEIYVGNLSYDMGEKDLLRIFQQYGDVRDARIIKHRFNGKSKGFGFVQMTNRAESAAAVKALSGSDIKGRKLVVNEAKSRARS